MERALGEQPRPTRSGKPDERRRAALSVTACSQPPDGRARRMLRLLADRMAQPGVVVRMVHECVRQELKKRSRTLAEATVAHPCSLQRGR